MEENKIKKCLHFGKTHKVLISLFLIIIAYNYAFPADLSKEELDYNWYHFNPADKYNSCYLIYVDFTKPLSEDRLFIIDYGEEPTVIYSGMCAHGNGKGNTSTKVVTSNVMNSHCSSVGRYYTGKIRKFLHFYDCIELHGLDRTNCNAYDRGILIHPSLYISLIPFPQSFINIPLTNSSQGCFAVSFHTMRVIKQLCKQSNKPILLYASQSNI